LLEVGDAFVRRLRRRPARPFSQSFASLGDALLDQSIGSLELLAMLI
jgi:hypothetical protein